MTVSDAWMYRVKAAQRDLIEACGGIKRVEDRFNYGKSTVGRWNDGNDPTLMPLGAIVALQNDCGSPHVTSALAEIGGRRLNDPETERKADISMMMAHAELMRQSAELANAMAMAIADGVVTHSEATAVDRIAASLERAASDLRASVSVVKARGGEKSSLRMVSGGDV